VIFAGGFGSGKSEVALNYALEISHTMPKVVIADLDLVNPYFATRDRRDELQRSEVRLIAPSGQLAFGDVPAVPGEMIGLLRQDNEMVIDVAGDEVGSLVLGYISRYIIARGKYELHMVLNPYRPFARDVDSVLALRRDLERASKLRFTHIVSNPNLTTETTPDLIIAGHNQVMKYAEAMNLPISALTVEKRYYTALLPIYGELLRVIDLYLRPTWLL